MAQIKLPTIRDTKPGASTEEKIQALTDAYYMLTKHLSFLLSNLDSDNVKELDADITKIKNLVAETIITYTLVTQTLYAEKGYIAELTVDQLDTSAKVRKYLNNDTTPVNYIKMYNQNIEFRTGEVKLNGNGIPLTEQAVDRNGNKLYWVDEERKAVQYEANDDPVMIYQYDELAKLYISFERDEDTFEYVPKIAMGVGIGNINYPDRGKAFIYKDTEGLVLKYIKANGQEVFLNLSEYGVFQSHETLSSLTFYNDGFLAEYGGTQVGYRWTKDSQGRITQLENIYTSEIVPVKWEGGSI